MTLGNLVRRKALCQVSGHYLICCNHLQTIMVMEGLLSQGLNQHAQDKKEDT